MSPAISPSTSPVRAPAVSVPAAERERLLWARLVSRAYRAADDRLRQRLLACLLRPLGTLSVAAVAAGAFGQFVYRRGLTDGRAAVDVVATFSRAQIHELARYAQEVDPNAMRQVAQLLSEHSAGTAAFSAAALVLLVQRLRAPRVGR